MAEKATDFHKQMQAERAYYLGMSDKIPGTDKTIAEVQKEYRKSVDKENERMANRRQEKVLDVAPPSTFTTAVTFGVTAEVAAPEAREPEVNMFGDNLATPEPAAIYSRESLGKLNRDELVVIARNERAHVVPDKATKDHIIGIILGEPLQDEPADTPA